MFFKLFGKKKLRVVFFGTPQFSVPSLACSKELFDIVAVVTQPDRPRGRGHKILPCEVKSFAEESNIPCFSPESLKKPSEELSLLQTHLAKHKPDLFVVLAYGNLLPASFLSIPRLGAVNLHASILPRWRGAAPIQRALEAGDNSTGVSLQKMVLKMDAGDVLFEKKLLIESSDNSETLSNSLSDLSASVLREYFSKHFKGTLVGFPQDEAFVTLASKIQKEEALWSPAWGSEEFHNKVRAFFVWPQVKVTLNTGESLAITKTRLEKIYKGPALSCGQILVQDGRVYLGTASSPEHDPVLEILQLKPPNKAAMNAWDYFQNHAARDTLTLT